MRQDLTITIRVDTSKLTEQLNAMKLPRLLIRQRIKFWKQKRVMKRLSRKYSPYIFMPCSPRLAYYLSRGSYFHGRWKWKNSSG